MRATAPLPPPVRSTPPSAAVDDARRLRRAPRVSYRRALAVGLGVSLALHLLIFLIARRTWLVPVPVERPQAPVLAVGGERAAMRVERVVVVPDAPAEADVVERVEPEERPEPEAVPAPVTIPGAVDAAPAPGASTLDRLRPRMADPRLWTRPELPPPEEPSDIEVVRARIARRIQEWNDSVAADAGRAADALDWTVKDGEGKRWGISPGKIHLGDLTIPVPVTIGGGPSPQREKAEERASRDREVAAQAERAAADENREERVRAIRDRKDQERREQKGGSTAGSGNGSGSTGSAGSGSGSSGGSGAGSGSGTGSGNGSSGGNRPGGN